MQHDDDAIADSAGSIPENAPSMAGFLNNR